MKEQVSGDDGGFGPVVDMLCLEAAICQRVEVVEQAFLETGVQLASVR